MLRGMMRLEERIVLDAAADRDDGADDAASGHILVVDNSLDGSDALIQAAGDGVVVVQYDSRSDTLDTLLDRIRDAGDGIDAIASIAFANHGDAGSLNLAADGALTLSELAENEDVAAFWSAVAEMLADDGTIDILSSDFYQSEEGQELLAALEALTGVDFTSPGDQADQIDYEGDRQFGENGEQKGDGHFGLQPVDNNMIESYGASIVNSIVISPPDRILFPSELYLSENDPIFDSGDIIIKNTNAYENHNYDSLSVKMQIPGFNQSLSSAFDFDAAENYLNTAFQGYATVNISPSSGEAVFTLYLNTLPSSDKPSQFSQFSHALQQITYRGDSAPAIGQTMTVTYTIGILGASTSLGEMSYNFVDTKNITLYVPTTPPPPILIDPNPIEPDPDPIEPGVDPIEPGIDPIEPGVDPVDEPGAGIISEGADSGDYRSSDWEWLQSEDDFSFSSLSGEIMEFVDLMSEFDESPVANQLSLELMEVQSKVGELGRSMQLLLDQFALSDEGVSETLEPAIAELIESAQQQVVTAARLVEMAHDTANDLRELPAEQHDGTLADRLASFAERLRETNALVAASTSGINAATGLLAETESGLNLDAATLLAEVKEVVDNAHASITADLERRDSMFYDREALRIKSGQIAGAAGEPKPEE